MSDQQQPAGWYPAPGAPGMQRYWDGQQWTEHQQPLPTTQPFAAAPPGAGPPPGAVPPPKQGGTPKWLIPVGVSAVLAVLAVVIGLIATSGDDSDDDTADSTTTTEEPAETTSGSDATTTEGSTESTGTTEGGGGGGGGAGDTFTAGDYTFTDVQVTEDFADDFSVQARVTNDGSAKSAVAFKVSIFSSGSVVGTADGYASEFAAGDTITVDFISLDDYTDWDELEFQVESEF